MQFGRTTFFLALTTCLVACDRSDFVTITKDRSYENTKASIFELMQTAGYNGLDKIKHNDCHEFDMVIDNMYDKAILATYASDLCSNPTTIGLLIGSSKDKRTDSAYLGIFKVLNFQREIIVTKALLERKNTEIVSADGACKATLQFDVENPFLMETYKRDLIVLKCRLTTDAKVRQSQK